MTVFLLIYLDFSPSIHGSVFFSVFFLIMNLINDQFTHSCLNHQSIVSAPDISSISLRSSTVSWRRPIFYENHFCVILNSVLHPMLAVCAVWSSVFQNVSRSLYSEPVCHQHSVPSTIFVYLFRLEVDRGGSRYRRLQFETDRKTISPSIRLD